VDAQRPALLLAQQETGVPGVGQTGAFPAQSPARATHVWPWLVETHPSPALQGGSQTGKHAPPMHSSSFAQFGLHGV
jgi:hypothetical protein